MNWGKTLALVNMACSLLACIGYLCVQDYRRATYWGSAAVLTASVTF